MSSDATAPRKSSATTKKIIFCAESRVLLPVIAIYMFSQLTKDRNPCIYTTPNPTLLIKKKNRQKHEDGEHSPKTINRIKTGKKHLFLLHITSLM